MPCQARQVPDDGEELRIPASNELASYSFRKTQWIMAKALARIILPKGLSGEIVRWEFPIRTRQTAFESPSQRSCGTAADAPARSSSLGSLLVLDC